MSYELELIRLRNANVALSARVEELRASLETVHQREMRIAGMLGCGLADLPEHVSALRSALGLEPGEDVLAEVQGIAEILRKSCVALGIHAEHAADIPGEIEKYATLHSEVVKALGFGAAENFADALRQRINRDLDEATRSVEAALSAALKSRSAAVADAETRTRKACADQVNAAQACIDRATKEHEKHAAVLRSRINAAERERDESRAAHHQLAVTLRDGLGLAPDADPIHALPDLFRELGTLRAQSAERDESRRALRAILDLMESALTPPPRA